DPDFIMSRTTGIESNKLAVGRNPRVRLIPGRRNEFGWGWCISSPTEADTPDIEMVVSLYVSQPPADMVHGWTFRSVGRRKQFRAPTLSSNTPQPSRRSVCAVDD